MTLTTDMQQFEEWLKFHSDEEECTNLLQRNSAGTNYLHPHADLAWIAWRASREALDNREAQPVAWRHDDGPFAGIAITRSKSVADNWMAKGWAVTPLYTDPPAPAVPDAVDYSDLDATSQDREVIEAIAECKGWNAYRAAMLAQPVSSGYTLPPHVYRELVNSLRDTAVKYQGTQQLREQLSRTLTENGLVAAAPEGGN